VTLLMLKEPKTFDEQIDLLKSRGLIIGDEDKAKFILSNINYYRFSAYLIHFKKEDETYKENITFEHIYNLYLFDKELRNILIDMLESIEISFRTYIAYTLAIKHGSTGYLNKQCFKKEKYFESFIKKLEDEKNNHKNKLFIKHHNEKYNGILPIWVAVEIMSFGTLSKLYSNMLPQDTAYIKRELCKVNPILVNSWLHSLTHLRNVCAHYGRIYKTYFPPVKVKNSDKNNVINDRQVFTYILAIKHLIADKNVWNDYFIKLQALFYKYDNYVELELLGFPENWVSILSL
jgi:abortive infection bacteriophage resistance protein